jgi:signal transduction histidine kinase
MTTTASTLRHLKHAYADRRQSLIFTVISIALWASVSLRWVTEFMQQEHPLTAVITLILLLYGLLLGLEPALTVTAGWRGHLYLITQLTLTLIAMLFFFELDFFALLLMPLTGQAAFIFPRRTAVGWGIIFLVANVIGQIHQFGWPGSLPFIFLYAAAIIFVAAFSRITLSADAARRRSQNLLTELQTAHDQLQTYANQAEELAIAQERNRLARELHDSVAQTLYGLTLQAEAAARKLAAGKTEEVAGYLTEFRDSARQTLQETRLLIFELRPPILDDVGLAAALQARLEAVEGRSGLVYDLEIDKTLALPPAVETGLYRIAQEALNNILKHAQARKISLTMQSAPPNHVQLEIVDDGVGFNPETDGAHGYGLRGMDERVKQLGGAFHLRSAPQAGTRINVEVPV